MKNTFTLICVLALAFSVSAQTNTPKNTSPAGTGKEALDFKETVYDFGKIPQGKPVTHDFEFTNTGDSAFALDNVQASCGCTTPVWNKDIIAPGETAKITVGYNAQNDGQFVKPVTITYMGNKTRQIIIKGEVWKTPVTSAPENSSVSSLKNE
ncbi:MAG TPA: DUF1573 domain-containing protein [Chitinophagaceae bacterium]|nr:DUF1573 domain-containing protein [Chitinophagaceae bacterium]